VRKEIIMPLFRDRTKGLGIFKVAPYKPDQVFADFPIEESGNVVLQSGDYSIILTNIQKESEGKFKGTVLGIEPPGAKLNDVTAGDMVTFTEEQVISASKRE
jgi:hypothetical protein